MAIIRSTTIIPAVDAAHERVDTLDKKFNHLETKVDRLEAKVDHHHKDLKQEITGIRQFIRMPAT